MSSRPHAAPEGADDGVLVTPQVLRDWRLPVPTGGKEARGSILVIGGSSETLGAVLLAAEAALRAGAGKLQVATAESVAPGDHARAVAMGDGWLAAHGWLDRDVWRLWAERPPRPMLRARLHAVAHMEAWLAGWTGEG